MSIGRGLLPPNGRLPNRQICEAQVLLRQAKMKLNDAPYKGDAPVKSLPWVVAQEIETLVKVLERAKQ